MINFNPKNPEIEKIFDRLTKYPGVSIEPRLALDIGRNKTIKYLRKKNHLFIANDRIKHRSIIFFPPNITVKRKNNGIGFFFEIK